MSGAERLVMVVVVVVYFLLAAASAKVDLVSVCVLVMVCVVQLVKGRKVVLCFVVVGGYNGGDRGTGRGVGVEEVGTSTGPAHGPGGSVVCKGGLLGCVEGAEPMPLFGGRVSYLGRVPAPRPPSHPEKPCWFLFALILLLLLLLLVLLLAVF